MLFRSELEVNELHVEAGATLAGALVQAALVDELLVYVAPMLLGPDARPLIELPPVVKLALAPRFVIRDTREIGTDVRLRMRP